MSQNIKTDKVMNFKKADEKTDYLKSILGVL